MYHIKGSGVTGEAVTRSFYHYDNFEYWVSDIITHICPRPADNFGYIGLMVNIAILLTLKTMTPFVFSSPDLRDCSFCLHSLREQRETNSIWIC